MLYNDFFPQSRPSKSQQNMDMLSSHNKVYQIARLLSLTMISRTIVCYSYLNSLITEASFVYIFVAATQFHHFFSIPEMMPVTAHFTIYHINAPGQEDQANALPTAYDFIFLCICTRIVSLFLKINLSGLGSTS